MIDVTLLKNILFVSVASSIVSIELIQVIKEIEFPSLITNILSFILSILIGIFFTLTFTQLTFLNSLWVGLISFIGADNIYKIFEEKIFNVNIIKIERPDI